MRKSLLAGLGLAVLSLMGCGVRVERAEDLTGDGKADVIAVTFWNRYLFIQQEDGSFIRTRQKSPYNFDNYFFDGEFYREAVKPGSTPEKK